MTVTARAVVSGPMHVFGDVDDEMVAVCGGRVLDGVPWCEAFPEPEYRPALQLYDFARAHQIPVAFIITAPDGESGIVSLRPRCDDRMHVSWEPCRPPHHEDPTTGQRRRQPVLAG